MNSKKLGVVVVAGLMALATPAYAGHDPNDPDQTSFTYILPHTQSKVRFTPEPNTGIGGVNVGPGITIWCQAGGHAYAPIGPPPGTPGAPSSPPVGSTTPQDYFSWATGELLAVDDYLVEWEGWVFSGQPECLPGDVANGNGALGIGGGAFVLNGHIGASPDTAGIVVVDSVYPGNVGFTVSIDMSGYCPSVSNYPCTGSGTPYPNTAGDEAIYCKDNEAATTPTLDGTLSGLGAPAPAPGNGRCDNYVYAECEDSQHSFVLPGDVPDHFQTTVPPLKLLWVTVHAVFIDATNPITNAVCLGTTGEVFGTLGVPPPSPDPQEPVVIAGPCVEVQADDFDVDEDGNPDLPAPGDECVPDGDEQCAGQLVIIVSHDGPEAEAVGKGARADVTCNGVIVAGAGGNCVLRAQDAMVGSEGGYARKCDDFPPFGPLPGPKACPIIGRGPGVAAVAYC